MPSINVSKVVAVKNKVKTWFSQPQNIILLLFGILRRNLAAVQLNPVAELGVEVLMNMHSTQTRDWLLSPCL